MDTSINTSGTLRRKRVEEELRRSEKRYHNIFNLTPIAIMEFDYLEAKKAVDGLIAGGVTNFRKYLDENPDFIFHAAEVIRITDVNDEAIRIYKAPDKEALLGPIVKIAAPETFDTIKNVLVAIAEGKRFCSMESVRKNMAGEIIHMLLRFAIPSEDDDFKDLLMCISDITERKIMEKELIQHQQYLEQIVERRTKALNDTVAKLKEEISMRKCAEELAKNTAQRYLSLVDNAGEAIIHAGTQGYILDVNKKAEELSGYAKEELLSMHYGALFTPGEMSHGDNHNGDDPTGYVFEKESPMAYGISLLRKDGKTLPVEATSSTIVHGSERISQIILRDVSYRKKIEEEVQKSQRLESIGVLAGGIAHDLNNILTALLGNLYVAMAKSEENSEACAILRDTEHIVDKAKNLSRQLLTFSKGGAPVMKPASMKSILRDSIDFSMSTYNAVCETSIQDDLWPVNADEGQIVQVMNNVILNAVQSMNDGGTIKIACENVTVTGDMKIPVPNGNYVRVIVKDTGFGIPAHLQSKIFDPYFTTKPDGNGLGLSICYSIVKKHDGYVTVESAEGKGSAFSVYLPAGKAGVAAQSELPARTNGKPGIIREDNCNEAKRILFMDDDPGIRDGIAAILTLEGYEVDLAIDGTEAIELYKRSKQQSKPHDAVIMDLTVPGGMGGRTAVSELRKIDPNVKAIVASGYYDDPVMANYSKFGFIGVVVKPYNVAELMEAITAVTGGTDVRSA
ncbi:MAG: PAS domain S-box protein [Nitrospirae bacterium]|nr:PAS domain S-box protein [Nitrospirota bacterium]